MSFSSRLSSLLLTRKDHARFLQNRVWLQGILEDFSLEGVLDIPRVGTTPCVMIYGSSVAGTAFQDGDADYAIVFPSKTSINDFSKLEKLTLSPSNFLEIRREYHQRVLSSILQHIVKRDLSVDLKHEQIFTARIPIIRLKKIKKSESEDIRFDISLSLDGLRNSLLLRLYMESDPRLRAGVLCAKKWGRSKGILDARRGWISPYALTVMYIFYMQTTKRTVSVINETDVDSKLFPIATQLSDTTGTCCSEFIDVLPCRDAKVSDVLEDLRGFFSFFGDCTKFDFDIDVVDIRTKDKWLSKEKWLEEMKKFSEKERWELLGYETIMVRDPFESHNLGRSVDFFRAEDIREAFRLASQNNCEELVNL
ncbi:putative RNA polymerase II [Trypanosoma theileri]|uniref:RNA uridylyltransferase n=1 Tax=Trypanosoma theileri TaxID=67003 RepID=A0A1X0NI50_9TRYP|nr:putative RNA polymerase II [Trypanosoma theileri]ORC84143.1 putative RNA polymerase II [Trypanosoma theileri]